MGAPSGEDSQRADCALLVRVSIGLCRLPSRQFAINAAWVELALTAADLLAWAQTTLLKGDLAAAEPATLRYRLLHVAARITRGQRPLFVRIDSAWPWREQLAAAFARLDALPQPITDQRPSDHPQQTGVADHHRVGHARTPRTERSEDQDRLVRDQRPTERPGLVMG